MAERTLTGKDGDLMIDGVSVARINSWSATIAAPTEEDNQLGDSFTRRIFLQSYDISGSGSASRRRENSQQEAIIGNLIAVDSGNPDTPGVKTSPAYAEATLRLYEDVDRVYEGPFLISNVGLNVTHGAKQEFSFDFEQAGEVVYYTGA